MRNQIYSFFHNFLQKYQNQKPILNQTNPFPVSGDQVYFNSIGPIIVSKPYPKAYPEYWGEEIHFVDSKRLSSIL